MPSLPRPGAWRPSARIGRLDRARVAISIGLALLAGGCADAPPRTIVLVIVDTLRADRVGCYGYDLAETPNLDSLAVAGTRFETAITVAPVTLPAVASIVTGTLPPQHGIRDNGAFRLSDRWTTLAETMQDVGFVTGGFVSADVLARRHGLDQGFDVYDDDLSAPFVAHSPRFEHAEDAHQHTERRADATVDRALAFLADHPDRDVFLLVHLFDPHVWRDPPPPFDRRHPRRPYDGEVAFTDAEVGRLLAGVRRRGPATTVVMGDHGEGLQEPHDEELHGFYVYDETTRVPLLVAGPGIPAGRVESGLVRSVDVLPTLCQAADAPVPPEAVGRPLPFGGEPDPEDRIAYVETFRPRLSYRWCELRAIRTDRWKLVEGTSLELYDLARDPAETTDLAEVRPGVRDSLAAMLDSLAFAAVRHAAHAPGDHEVTDELRARLRSLGYVSADEPDAAAARASIEAHAYHFPADQRGRALELPDPRDEVPRYNRRLAARSFEQAGDRAMRLGRIERARRLFERAIERDAGYASPHRGLALAFERAGDPDRAVQVLRAAREHFPDDVEVITALAGTLWRAGRLDAALAAAEASGEPAALDLRATLLTELGRLDQAAEVLNALSVLVPGDPSVWRRLAEVHDRLGHEAQARACAQHASRLDETARDG